MFAHLDAGLTVRHELERTAQDVASLLVEVRFERPAGIRFAVMLPEHRLFVEQIDLARPAVLKQADDRLRLRLQRDRSMSPRVRSMQFVIV